VIARALKPFNTFKVEIEGVVTRVRAIRFAPEANEVLILVVLR